MLKLYYVILQILNFPKYCFYKIISLLYKNKTIYEKLGIHNNYNKKKQIIWIHVDFIRDLYNGLSIIRSLQGKRDDIQIIMTARNKEYYNVFKDILPNDVDYLILPLKYYQSMNSFLRYWQPKCCIYMSRNFNVDIILTINKFCPILNINMMLSENKYIYLKLFRKLALNLLCQFSSIIVKSKYDLKKLQRLSYNNAFHYGDIQFHNTILSADSSKMSHLIKMIGEDRKIFLASSIHKNEEDFIIKIHQKLKSYYNNILTIIIPFNYKRGKKIHKRVKQYNLNSIIRSKNEIITNETDIYIADTIGELGIFYRIANIVFIGGSISNYGGHNPIEAAKLNSAIIVGNNMNNFHDIIQGMKENNACIQLNKYELFEKIRLLIDDVNLHDSLSQNALEFVKKEKNDIDLIIKHILDWL